MLLVAKLHQQPMARCRLTGKHAAVAATLGRLFELRQWPETFIVWAKRVLRLILVIVINPDGNVSAGHSC